jgi:enterochelin esterase-like enzyme
LTAQAVRIALFCSSILGAADFSGRYKGALESSTGSRLEIIATIHQQGDKVTGSIGPTQSPLTAMEDAKLESGKLTFRVKPAGGMRFTIPEAGETLSGTISGLDGKSALYERVTLRRVGPVTLADTMPALPNEGPHPSMRILKLRDAIAQNPESLAAKLNEFWTEVKSSGTPLVEVDPFNDRFQLATFLWQGKPEHKSVLVLWSAFSTNRPADFLMVNLPNTDVWFRTIRFPRGARIEYRLSANDPLASIPPADTPRNPVKDPLNPKGVLLELPGALPQPYYERRDGTPKMTQVEHTLKSQHLKQDRRVLIYTPPGFDPKAKPYPSIYFFDGEDNDGLVFATWTFENMIAAKKIPPMVVVRIVNPNQATRNTQLAAQEPFFDFVAHELVPYIRANYNVSAKPGETAISGYSFGGFASAFAGLRHSDVFGLILAQSGSYWWVPENDGTAEPNWIAKKFLESPKLPLRFYMDAGLFELDLSGRGGAILLPNRHLRDVLRAKGYEVTYQEFPGGHDYINWRGTVADGLIALFGLNR